jgi:uncharacterized protein (UPF0548 family)
MTRRPPRTQRLAVAVRWPVGLAWTSWRYMWRTTPIHRWELIGSRAEDLPPPFPEGVDRTDVQHIDAGVGAVFHRVYRTSIRASALSSEGLMARIAADPDVMVPSEIAKFQKVRGRPGDLAVGDEFVVRMPGPWDGPVRVIARTAEGFRLATLDGHLEAGQIEFCAHSGSRSIEFVIESWARSGDRLSDFLYAHLRMAKEIQLHMWTSVLERVVRLAHGRMDGGIHVLTRRVEEDDGGEPWRRGAGHSLAGLRDRSVNFDASQEAEHTASDGWNVDDLSVELPPEQSGEPVDGGSWQTARQLVDDYQVADPGRLRAVFDADAPLENRDMLLEIRFLFLRIYVGVRIRGPYDERRLVEGRPARVFGWSYRTLDGHFEVGEMHYQIWKWLDDGTVEFRIHAYSRGATDVPLWVRLGFRLVGRRQQLAYYRNACRRMRRLTESQLDLADVRRRGTCTQ